MLIKIIMNLLVESKFDAHYLLNRFRDLSLVFTVHVTNNTPFLSFGLKVSLMFQEMVLLSIIIEISSTTTREHTKGLKFHFGCEKDIQI